LQASIANRNVRTASFAASACLVALACVILLISSRVVALLDPPAIQGVSVRLETRPLPHRPLAPPHRAAVATTNVNAPPTATTLPMARDVLQRIQACSNPDPHDRPADCPRLAQTPDWQQSGQLPVGGDFNRPPPINLDQAFTRGELMARAVPPPCQLGFRTTNVGTGVGASYCTHTYPDPPPPARDPDVICDAGGIGPCHPPAFRQQDVVLLAHTQ
jgi:hypothetical protein